MTSTKGSGPECSPLRHELHEPVIRQAAQCLRHGGAADVVVRRQRGDRRQGLAAGPSPASIRWRRSASTRRDGSSRGRDTKVIIPNDGYAAQAVCAHCADCIDYDCLYWLAWQVQQKRPGRRRQRRDPVPQRPAPTPNGLAFGSSRMFDNLLTRCNVTRIVTYVTQ